MDYWVLPYSNLTETIRLVQNLSEQTFGKWVLKGLRGHIAAVLAAEY